jgi:hypothetical protein
MGLPSIEHTGMLGSALWELFLSTTSGLVQSVTLPSSSSTLTPPLWHLKNLCNLDERYDGYCNIYRMQSLG